MQISVKLCEKTVTSWGAKCEPRIDSTNYKLDFIMTNRVYPHVNTSLLIQLILQNQLKTTWIPPWIFGFHLNLLLINEQNTLSRNIPL